jgi:hypothetical protein
MCSSIAFITKESDSPCAIHPQHAFPWSRTLRTSWSYVHPFSVSESLYPASHSITPPKLVCVVNAFTRLVNSEELRKYLDHRHHPSMRVSTPEVQSTASLPPTHGWQQSSPMRQSRSCRYRRCRAARTGTRNSRYYRTG